MEVPPNSELPDPTERPSSEKLPNFTALLRAHFFTGLLVFTPLAVIAWIFAIFFNSLWQMKEILPDEWRPENFLQNDFLAGLVYLVIALAGSAFFAGLVSVLGWSSKQYLGQKVLELVSDGIQRIPVVRTIYSALDQLLRTFASGGGGQQFNRVVYLEYPRKGVWVIAFVTGSAPTPPGCTGRHLNVYVPTTPNPTSGFHLIVPEAEVKETSLKVEDAFKTILSLGIAQGDKPNGG